MNIQEAREAFAAGVREDGTVEGHRIETYYHHCKAIATDHKIRCLRVISDNGATNIETRILFDTLIAEGWTPPLPNAIDNRPEGGLPPKGPR